MDHLLEIIKQAQQGDKDAFGKLYKEYYQRIYRYCRIHMYDDQAAEDVCQETFLRAWKSLPSFTITQDGTFQAFLFRIAKNLIIDLSRKKKVFSLAEYEEIETDEDFAEALDRASDIDKVRLALSRLKEEERQILVLRYFEDLSHTEIAKIIGIKEGALRVRTVRLLKKVKEILKKHE